MNLIAPLDSQRENRKLSRLFLYFMFSLLTRAGLWGDWNYEVDDQFYALVGQRLLSGATLYVDIWDRKGPLLYFTYALLGLISSSVIVYQLAATVCVAWSAIGIAKLADHLARAPFPATVAGLAYCMLILQFGGANGQSAIFFEPLVITAAASLVISRVELEAGHLSPRLLAGFACAGAAIAFKQSAAIEATGLGLMAIGLQVRGRVRTKRLLLNTCALAAIGILPMALCAAWFWFNGHFAAFWQAMVSSNLMRVYMPDEERMHRLPLVMGEMVIPVGFAVIGWLKLRKTSDPIALNLVVGWCLAAVIAIAIYPNIINHYLLTTLPPLCVLASGLYQRDRTGIAALAGLALSVVPQNHALRWGERAASRQASHDLVDYVESVTPDHKLLVWGAPSYLYVLTDSPPPSPLAFPPHLFDAAEANSSGRDQAQEVRRILSQAPSTVVVQFPLPAAPLNPVSTLLVADYVKKCGKKKIFHLFDQYGAQTQKVFSNCNRALIQP